MPASSASSVNEMPPVVPLSSMERKVALITGANGGLGLGIACRLLDSIPASVPLVLVISARHLRKAVDTITLLRQYSAKHGRDDALLSFDYVLLDLGSLSSVYEAAGQLLERYSHIDYLFLNAGGGDFIGVDWIAATLHVLRDPRDAVTYPRFKKERVGRMSSDGYGWVFQINVLANYVLMQELLPALRNGGRVILVSSIETQAADPFNADDLQLVKTKNSYVDSKRQLEILHAALAKSWEEQEGVLIYLTHPGICQTAIFAEFLNWFTTFGMLALFYIARLLGSPWHVITSYKGANAPVWAALNAMPEAERTVGFDYGSATDAWGRELVKAIPADSDEDKKYGLAFLAELDKLSKEAQTKFKVVIPR
ncbi:uncharacterized protein V1518DRAFT_414128 [Limtongia smithiae]|uniref:uncharacterized protein n=1 Tax=Limtongia smithiae TaxID=1125753 RepID=UPI0034CD8B20